MTATHATPFDEPAGDDGATADDADERDAIEESADEPDYFAVLGVSPAATTAELRQAYRRLAKLWHPDRYVDASPALRAQAERRMRALTRAYAALSDPVQRSMYVLRRSQQEQGGDAHWSDGYSSGASAYHAYGAWSWGDWQDEARANPNGAGMFFGLLALVIGIGLVAGALNAGSPAPLLFGGLALLVFLALAAALFTKGSPLARAANAWIEHEPRGYADPYAAARASQQRRASGRASTQYATHSSDAAATSQNHTPTTRDLPGEDTDDGDWSESDADGGVLTRSGSAGTALREPDEVDAARFERYVVAAVESLPAEFRRRMPNVVVRVADEPDDETLRKMCVSNGQTLFGLYEGVPLTAQGAAAVRPEVITIYRRPIERSCGGDQARLRKQIRKTVFHEVAHHFGISHEEMPDWVR